MRRFYRLIKFSSNSNWLFIKFLQLPDIRKQVAHILCRLLSPTSTKVRVWHHSAILLDWLNAPCRWQAMNNRCIFYSSVTVKVDSNTGKNSMITSIITTYERRLLWPRSKGIYIIGSFIWMAGISTAQTKLLLPIMETRYWIGFILTEILMAKALDCFFITLLLIVRFIVFLHAKQQKSSWLYNVYFIGCLQYFRCCNMGLLNAYT